MPRVFSAALARELTQISSTHVITALFELIMAGAPGPIRFANYDQDIVFHGLLFLAFPVDVDSLEDGNAASLTHLQVHTANVDQQVQSLLENYWTTDPEWTVTLWVIDAMQPDETPYEEGADYTVMGVTTDFVTASFDLLADGLTLTEIVPGRRYTTSSGYPNLPRR